MRATMLLVLATIVGYSGVLAAQEHHGHGAGLAGLVLDDGKRWPTDPALRDGMSRIRAALPDGEAATRLSAEQAGRLARTVRSEVDAMIRACKLPPRADAMLHVVLAHLLRGAQEIDEGGTPDARHSGLRTVSEALNAYGSYFDDPGWRKPAKP